MKNKGLAAIPYHGFLFAIGLICCLSRCGPKKGEAEKWEVFPNPQKYMVQLPCNADSVLYTNDLKTRVLIRFDVNSKCEFTGRAEKLNTTDSTLAYREIKGYASGQQQMVKGSFELDPGEKLYVSCQRGTTVQDEGCNISWWLVGKVK